MVKDDKDNGLRLDERWVVNGDVRKVIRDGSGCDVGGMGW